MPSTVQMLLSVAVASFQILAVCAAAGFGAGISLSARSELQPAISNETLAANAGNRR